MSENKDSIIFYKSFYESIKELPEENQLEIYNAIFEKYFFKNDIELNGISKAIFLLIVPNIDSANKRYFANIENGKKGGRPKIKSHEKTIENPNKTQSESEKNLDVEVEEEVEEEVYEKAEVAVDEDKKQTFSTTATTKKIINIEDIIKQFKKSHNPSEFEKDELIKLSKQYSIEKVLEAVKIAQKQDALNIRYIEGVLKTPDKNQKSEEELLEKETKRKENEELVKNTQKKLEEEALEKATLNLENTDTSHIPKNILKNLNRNKIENEDEEDEM